MLYWIHSIVCLLYVLCHKVIMHFLLIGAIPIDSQSVDGNLVITYARSRNKDLKTALVLIRKC